MEGLETLAPHLYTIALLWLAVIIIVQIVKWAIFRGMEKVQADEETGKEIKERKEYARKVVYFFNLGTTVIASGAIIICVFFLYNPAERSYEELDRIKTATVDEDYVPPSEEEIEALNIESHDVKKSEEKKAKAHEENIEAMDESVAIFRKAAKEAEDANEVKR